MSLFDLIVEAANKVKSNGAGLYNKIKGVQAPQLNMELLSEDGGTDVTKTMEMLDKTTPLTFGERMTGRKLSRDFQKYNPETKQFEMTTATINRPGLLQDISQGYEENRFTPVSLDNLQQNTLDNGREKGFAYRLGEGLGSLARLGNSPLGRGLLVGGLVGATGGNGLEALTYGAGATMLNQGNVLRDRTYRNDLINTQKQSLMSSPEWNNLTPEQQQARLSEIENSINNYRGYMTDDIYKNLVNTQQARDNAAYRQMYFDAQQRNLEAQREWQRLQAEKENQLRQQQLYLTGRGQDLDYALGTARLAQEAEKNNKGKVDIDKLNGVKTQLENFDNIFESVNNPYRYRIFGGASEKLNTFSPEESNFMTQANLLFNIISRDLGGEKGVLSDQDIQRIKEGMPKLQDTIDQKRAKMSAIYSLLEIKLGQHGIPFNNPYDIYGRKKEQTTSGNNQAITTTNQPKTNTSKSNTTKSGVKYEVIN